MRNGRRCLKDLSAIDPPPDFLVASGSLPPGAPSDFYARAARIGRDRRAKVIIDTSGDPLNPGAGGRCFSDQTQLSRIPGSPGEDLKDESQIRAEAEKMVQTGRCEIMVISLGAAGALLVSNDITEPIRPPTVPIVSKVGAGDSMVAGIVLSLARGQTIRESVLFGIAAGAAAVMTPGSELCRREDAERLYARMGSEPL